MWDVLWTDPDRELVGEHRAKKGKDRKLMGSTEQRRDRSHASSKPNSVSTRSSLSSVDSPFSFLRSRKLRHVSSPGAGAGGSGSSSRMKSSASASSSLASPKNKSSTTQSPMSAKFDVFDVVSRRSSSVVSSRAFHEPADISRATQTSPTPAGKAADDKHEPLSFRNSSRASVCSARDDDSDAVTACSTSEGVRLEHDNSLSLIQPLGLSSFVTKETEIVTENLGSSSVREAATQVVITSPRNIEAPKASPKFATLSASPTSQQLCRPPPSPVPPARSPLRGTSRRWSMTPKHHDPDAWQPPDEWDCVPQNPSMAKDLTDNAVSAAEIKDERSPQESLADHLQKEVKRMSAAGPDIVLSRLKEGWNTTPDSGLHEEVQAEKKRWMLSTLHHLDVVRDPEPSQDSMIAPEKIRRLLAFCESNATTAYLAALYSNAQVYQLSSTTSHGSEGMPKNIHPVHVPTLTPNAFPTAPGMFDLVYCLSLASLCPSSEIMPILRNIHKTLKPDGILRITLVDPLPCAQTLGHRLRAWLEEHVVKKLERDFRCLRPTKLFTLWLGQASLRGPGSTVMAAKFFAMPQSVYMDREIDPDAHIEARRRDRETKAELRSLVGRMLWLEVWGRYVTADRMWWEDPVLVQECLELGTFWQYQIIEGVKET